MNDAILAFYRQQSVWHTVPLPPFPAFRNAVRFLWLLAEISPGDTAAMIENRFPMSSFELLWESPPDNPRLNDLGIHIWSIALDKQPEQIAFCELTLSPDERDRASRFAFPRDRARFIIGRGVLRAILGSYLSVQPAQVHFVYSSRGKPALAALPEQKTLHFNLAHSGGLALVSVTRVCELGIDVEKARDVHDTDEIATHYFSKHEAEQLKKLSKDRHLQAFYNLWTRKEACLKATGDGITELLHQVEVSFLPNDPPRVISITGARQAEQWTLEDLRPAANFVGAVAAPVPGLRVSCWRWPEN
jgi:4'-phosphopantetheinyl transferase